MEKAFTDYSADEVFALVDVSKDICDTLIMETVTDIIAIDIKRKKEGWQLQEN